TQISVGSVENSEFDNLDGLDQALSSTSDVIFNTVTADLTGDVTGNVSGTSSGFTGNLGGDITGPQGSTEITANAVTTAEIMNGTISLLDMGPSSVSGNAILDNTIQAVDIDDGVIGSLQIADGGVDTDDINSSAVTEAELNISVAGDGLLGGGGTALSVNVGNGLAINTDQVEVDESALDLANLGGTLDVASGGTGATTVADARTNIGLGTSSSPTFQGLTITDLSGAQDTYTGDGTTNSFTISATGAFSSSDIRLKENIENLKTPLEKIKETEGVKYNFKSDSKEEVHFGVIAQDIEKIFPNLVRTDDKGYKSVNYTELIPVLIEALKEQQKLIESLQVKLDDEKSTKEDLKAALDGQKELLNLQASAMLSLQQENNKMKSDIGEIKKALGLGLEASDR
ncbi:MAG: tail fiber domain-containing protein, partial [Bacteroidota bacterium]